MSLFEKFSLALAVATIVTAISVLAYGADFSVDSRSLMHLSCSAAIGYGVDSALIAVAPKSDKVARRAMAFGACMVPGLYKEYVMDAYADMGDITFNAIGCGIGIWIGDSMWLSVDNDVVALNGRW